MLKSILIKKIKKKLSTSQMCITKVFKNPQGQDQGSAPADIKYQATHRVLKSSTFMVKIYFM